jgi:hypothetical protein
MRKRPQLSTEREVVDFVTLYRINQVCEQHKTDKKPEELLVQLTRFDKNKLQKIKEREGGFPEFIRLILVARDAMKKSCNK